MKWEDHSVAELRTVARAYKKHMMIGAPSKMSKKELIAVLDKHLMIEEGTNKIKIRAVGEQPLMGKNLEKSKKERLAKVAAKKTPKKSAEAEAKAAYATVKPDILKTSTQMMSAFFDAEQIKLDAEIMMAQMKTDALKAEREKIIQEKTFSQGRGAAADAMAIRPPVMEAAKATTTKDLIQGLPQELQDKIFGFLPQNLKKDVTQGTKKEQEAKVGRETTDLLKNFYERVIALKGREDITLSLNLMEKQIRSRLNNELGAFSREERDAREKLLEKIVFIKKEVYKDDTTGASGLRIWNYRNAPSLLTFHGAKFNEKQMKYLKKYDVLPNADAMVIRPPMMETEEGPASMPIMTREEELIKVRKAIYEVERLDENLNLGEKRLDKTTGKYSFSPQAEKRRVEYLTAKNKLPEIVQTVTPLTPAEIKSGKWWRIDEFILADRAEKKGERKNFTRSEVMRYNKIGRGGGSGASYDMFGQNKYANT